MGLKSLEKTISMIIPNMEELVDEDHRYRAVLKLFDWTDPWVTKKSNKLTISLVISDCWRNHTAKAA